MFLSKIKFQTLLPHQHSSLLCRFFSWVSKATEQTLSFSIFSLVLVAQSLRQFTNNAFPYTSKLCETHRNAFNGNFRDESRFLNFNGKSIRRYYGCHDCWRTHYSMKISIIFPNKWWVHPRNQSFSFSFSFGWLMCEFYKPI